MSRAEFEAIVTSVADYFPPEDDAMNAWHKYKIRDADAVVKALKRHKLFKQHYSTIKPIISRIVDDIPDAQLGKDLIAIVDTYYPGIIASIVQSDNDGDRSDGDLLRDVIVKLIAEVRA
jgi:hypothetical protein